MDTLNEETKRITLKEFEVLNTSTSVYPGTVSGKTWSVKDFEKKLQIRIVKKNKSEMSLEFDLIGIDPSLANAFRRIMISEVPTMAIEKVHIYNNTSIIQDEVFSHRLGLIPLKADPRLFEMKSAEVGDQGTEKDTLEFELKVKCKKNVSEDKEGFTDRCVYSKHIKWIPKENQKSWIANDPGPMEGDILLNKLLPGHELDMKLYAYKGIGKDHAKFSPVATAFYRLLPEIILNEEITGERAERLKSCFSPGVIKLTGSNNKAEVTDARYDQCSRNVLRYDDLKEAVTLNKVRDHFIFTVESTGAIQPEDIFVQAVDILEQKCDLFLAEMNKNVKK